MNIKSGILSMIAASTSFSFVHLIVRMSGSRLPLFEQILSRNFFMAIISYLMLKRAGLSILPEKAHIKDLFFRSLFGFLGLITVFYSNRNMPLTDAQILQKLSPFFVAFFAWLLNKEKVSRRTIAGMSLAFAGAIFVIGPAGNFANIATIAALSSGVFLGLAYSFVHRLSGKEPSFRIVFYFSTLSLLLTIPFAILDFVIPTPGDFVMLFLIGLFASIGQYFVTRAYQLAPASQVAIFDYTGLLLTPLLSFIFLSESSKWPTFAGGFFILLGAWISMKHEHHHEKKRKC